MTEKQIKANEQKEAIAFAKWIASKTFYDEESELHDVLTLIDHDWYWNRDSDGDQPLTEEELYEMYLEDKPTP